MGEETVSKGELVLEVLASFGDHKNETLTGQVLLKLLESINFTVGPPISITEIASSLRLQQKTGCGNYTSCGSHDTLLSLSICGDLISGGS